MRNLPKIVGVILASGQSKRMGKAKLLLSWRGQTLIEHLLYKTSSIPFCQVRIVIPGENEYMEKLLSIYHCETIYNPSPQLGLGYSLSLAFQTLPPATEAAIILLGDQPTLNKDDIQNVWRTYEKLKIQHNTCPKAIIQVKYRDGRIGHPVLFSSHFFNDLKSLEGDKGGRVIIEKYLLCVHYCMSENEYPEDIDTPSDYEHLLNKT